MIQRRAPLRHGTLAGYWAHYRYGEPMCEPCRQSYRVARGYLAPQRQAQCGTPGGYKRHKRLGEQTCPECRAAEVARRKRQRAAAAERCALDYVDEVAVERACRGDRSINLTRAEMAAALAWLTGRHYSLTEIAALLGVSDRAVSRWRSGRVEMPRSRPGQKVA